MYARTVTIRGRPEAIDDGITYLRDEVMPVLQQTPEYVGTSMLADRASRHCIAATAWDTAEAMLASAERFRPMRQRFAAVLGGSAEVRGWDIAVLHRVHEAARSACTRVTWTQTDPDRMDEILDAYRLDLLPRLAELDGFCSASLLVDRREGRAAGAVTYVDRQALRRSRTDAMTIRKELAGAMGSRILAVGEFDLVLAHLRVPETV